MDSSSSSGGAGTRQPLLEVGRVDRPHGLLGEVVVSLITNRTERIAPGAELTWRAAPSPPGSGRPGGSQPEPGKLPGSRFLAVRRSRPFRERYLVEFEGVYTREAAEELRGGMLLAAPVEDPDALFVHDLVGMQVVELDGTPHGTVLAVQANPASDLLVLDDGTLVPLRFVVSRRDGRLEVDVPAGLFE